MCLVKLGGESRRALAFMLTAAGLAVCLAHGAEEDKAVKPLPAGRGLSVDAQGTLLKDGVPYRGVGINYFSAFSRRLENPQDTSYREGFAELSKRGIPFVRFMACGYWPKDYTLYQQDKEAYFRLMDDVVKAAEETGIGLIPSLFWYTAAVPDLVGEPRNAWGDPGSKTHAFMRQYVREAVSRYRNSPAIWVWELGNEYSLDADLPNAAEHRPPIWPGLGTALSRSEADDLTHDMLVTAHREFAKAVREHDPARPVTSGASMPRPSAQHLRLEGRWLSDSREEFATNLTDITPDPLNLASVHLYPFDRDGRFGGKVTSYEQVLAACMETTAKARKALFVGEFGAPDDAEHGGPDRAKREFLEMLSAIERTNVPLSAVWVFDLSQQDSFINVTPVNSRRYVLEAIRQANRRIKLYQTGLHRLEVRGGDLSGVLLDNDANREREGAGLNPLRHAAYPGANVFRGDHVGLNFEHLFNGRNEDTAISMFTPRKDTSVLIQHSPSSATVQFPAKESAWGVEAEMRYTFTGQHAIDLEFTATLTRDVKHVGYLALMWASYMNHTRERTIHFYGVDGEKEGWLTFGEDLENGFEKGTIAFAGVPPLPFEEGSETLNIIEHPAKRFLLPFYYGLVDGDGDPATTEDTMVYIMMFDQKAPIRFALWNFITDMAGNNDPRSPAWDWQYVIRDPKVGPRYGYHARVIYKPFVSQDDVKQEYLAWRGRGAE